jgi:hypothetical protein
MAKTIEVIIKLIIKADNDTPQADKALKDRIEDDLFGNLDKESSFQAEDDLDYYYKYESLKVDKIKTID